MRAGPSWTARGWASGLGTTMLFGGAVIAFQPPVHFFAVSVGQEVEVEVFSGGRFGVRPLLLEEDRRDDRIDLLRCKRGCRIRQMLLSRLSKQCTAMPPGYLASRPQSLQPEVEIVERRDRIPPSGSAPQLPSGEQALCPLFELPDDFWPSSLESCEVDDCGHEEEG